MKTVVACAVIGLAVLAGGFASSRADQADGAVYVIFDASGSMWQPLPDKSLKIQAAREVLKEFAAGDFGGRQLALRAYGHNRKADCDDTELVVPFSNQAEAQKRMTAFADNVNPKGKTPIGKSLMAALEDFGDRPGEIILISDGIETCDVDPCELVRSWMEKDVKIKVHVVGLGLTEEEKTAMQCISTAAGTEFQDAASAAELSEGLAKIQETRQTRALVIRATTADGERLRVEGTAEGPEGTLAVQSNGRNAVPVGEHVVSVGVRTRNGDLYRPVKRTVTLGETGEVVLEVVVEKPPTVSARFVEQGEEHRGSLITALQDGDEVFRFRAQDTAFVNPGTYQFTSEPNADNKLSVTETFDHGEHKQIIFKMGHTVLAAIKMVAKGSGIDFRENYELWQDGAKVKGVHWVNGVRAIPGTYDLHLPNRLTPYVHKGLVLTDEARQTFRIEIPVGHVTVVYQTADGLRDDDVRCFPERWTGDRWVKDKIRTAGQRIPLVPGRYRMNGWNHAGKTYSPHEFEIASGDEMEIILRNETP